MFRIPMPKMSGEILDEGVKSLMERLMKEKQIQNEAAYRNATLAQGAQKEAREALQAPLDRQLTQAKIGSEESLAQSRKNGGGRFSTGTGDELKYHSTIADYNPNLTPAQIREAGDVYAEGKNVLSDGTKLVPMNPTIERALNRAFKSTTTSPLITQGVRANAAEAEMPVIDKAIQEGRSPYGDTTLGMSPLQIKDTFDKKNPDAQKRLGNYIASDMLSFDKAALQTRIAGTESGVTIINEVMNKAKQSINAKYPMLSDAARQHALEKIGTVLKDMLKARNKYGIGATKAVGNNQEKSSNDESDDPFGIRS